jgi:hypothetical protein
MHRLKRCPSFLDQNICTGKQIKSRSKAERFLSQDR